MFIFYQDARVRTAAFHSLITIHGQGVKLNVSLYPVLCSALRDDYEGVRCEVLRILVILAETEPEHQVDLHVGDNFNLLNNVIKLNKLILDQGRRGEWN